MNGSNGGSKPHRESSAKEKDPAVELAQLRARIAQARELMPKGSDVHCGHCFGMGRRAAIAAITGEPEE